MHNIIYTYIFLWRCDPTQAMASSFLRFLDHTQRRSTVGRTPLDEWSARRRDLYLTTHNTQNRQISMPPVGFEPSLSADERPQTHALDRAATGTVITHTHTHTHIHTHTHTYIYVYVCVYTYTHTYTLVPQHVGYSSLIFTHTMNTGHWVGTIDQVYWHTRMFNTYCFAAARIITRKSLSVIFFNRNLIEIIKLIA